MSFHGSLKKLMIEAINTACQPLSYSRFHPYRGRSVFLLLLSLSALVWLKSPASAALLLQESFDYPAYQSINKQSGGTGFISNANGVWNRSDQPFPDQITNGGLTFQNLATSGNALLSHVGGGDDDSHQSVRLVNPVSLSGTFSYWFSFLMRLDSIPEGSAISDFQGYVSLWHTSGYSLRAGISWGEASLSVTSSINNSPSYAASNPIEIGQTYFIVLHIETNNIVTMYINPTPGVDSPSDLFKVGSGTLSIPTQFSRLGIFSTGEDAEWIFDEFRMGTTYLDVAPIPEPSYIGLLALSGGILLVRQHRKSLRRRTLMAIE